MTLPTNEQFDELDELHARILGRSKFCRCRGEVKTPDLLDECAAQHIADAKRIAELEAALRQAKKYLEHEPEYHDQGMGCGLEDRNITDRYDAMAHGWDQAMERAFSETVAAAVEEINTALEATP